MISTPCSVISPTALQTFDVPMSNPTMMLCFFAIPVLPNFFFTAAGAAIGLPLDPENLHPRSRVFPLVPATMSIRDLNVGAFLPNRPSRCEWPPDARSYRPPNDLVHQSGSPTERGNLWP